MEMKQIPDYPNYAVTKDGRVWSYNRNKFIYCIPRQTGTAVFLSYEGMKFMKLVRRLVYETFYEYSPEVVINRDGNVFNNNIENLLGLTWAELNQMIHQRPRKTKPICRVEIATRKLDIIEVRKKSKDYERIHHALQRRTLTSGGCFYYYPDEKDKLIDEIKAHIYANKLSLNRLLMQDKFSPFISVIKRHLKTQKNYLEILKKV